MRDEGLTTGAAIDTKAGNLVWDPQDPLFEFNNKNSGVTQIPVAASTPVVMLMEDGMPDLEDVDPKEPSQRNPPGVLQQVPLQ